MFVDCFSGILPCRGRPGFPFPGRVVAARDQMTQLWEVAIHTGSLTEVIRLSPDQGYCSLHVVVPPEAIRDQRWTIRRHNLPEGF